MLLLLYLGLWFQISLAFFESGAPKNEACTQDPSFITHTGLGVIKSKDHS